MLLPVVTKMKQAAMALRWTVDEMERRYQLSLGTKNLFTYPKSHFGQYACKKERQPHPIPVPHQNDSLARALLTFQAYRHRTQLHLMHCHSLFLLIVVDEFSDLMMHTDPVLVDPIPE